MKRGNISKNFLSPPNLNLGYNNHNKIWVPIKSDRVWMKSIIAQNWTKNFYLLA
jgi:hypothetical protein